MGIKFLNLQMLPLCFLGGKYQLSCVQLQPEPPAETIKVIRSDGVVKIYHRPVPVSELMVESPKHLLCRSDSFYIGQKIPPLSENDELELGQNYFLLPSHFFQSVLSFVTVASFIYASSQESKNVFLRKAANCQPFDIQKAPSGSLKVSVSDEFISQLMMEDGNVAVKESKSTLNDESSNSKLLCTTPQLHKDYAQLVGSCQQWKPKLETIRESSEKKKKRRLSSLGLNGKKKGATQKSQRSPEVVQQQLHLTHSTKASSKSKVKSKLKK